MFESVYNVQPKITMLLTHYRTPSIQTEVQWLGTIRVLRATPHSFKKYGEKIFVVKLLVSSKILVGSYKIC